MATQGAADDWPNKNLHAYIHYIACNDSSKSPGFGLLIDLLSEKEDISEMHLQMHEEMDSQ